jgi:hypothetical protein
MKQMPKDYWLKGDNTKFLLACMVHRTNKEIATKCSSLPASVTREVQRSNAAARVAAERLEARNERKRRERDDITGLRIRNNMGQTSLIKSRNELVMNQIRLYNENKEAFVATMGQEAFNAKIMELLNKLPDPSSIRMSIDDPNVNEGGDTDDEQEDRDNNN